MTNHTKKISIVSPCFNEQENVEGLYGAVKKVMANLPYQYEHIFIDNSSTDNTASILRKIAAKDKNIKIIINAKNYGHIRSPYYGLLQAEGDAVILLASDFQDPPELIPRFIKKWEEGYKTIVGVKTKSEENPIIFSLRKLYYFLIKKASDTEQIRNFTGYGLYDKTLIATLRELNDPYPYFRGLIAEYGFDRTEIEFTQPTRKKGRTKNNFYTLYDMAMLGFVNHSRMPIRIASFAGFILASLSLLAAILYLFLKIIFWQEFSVGTAPLVIGLFFFSSIQLIFIGIIGEYIGAIFTQVKNHPLVVEKERINFEK